MSQENGNTPGVPPVITSASPMTDADAAQLRAEEAAAASSILGDQYRHMDSGRFDLDPRGIAAPQPPGTPFNEPAPVQPDYAPTSPVDATVADEVAYWKGMYGRSENEKGEWRRRASAADDVATRLADTQAQLLAMQQQQLALQQQAAYGAPQAPQPPPAAARITLFGNKAPEDVVTAGEIEDAINRFAYEQISPYVDSRVGLGYQRAVADSQRRFGGWDVKPQEEAAVAAKFPWLQNVPPVERNQFVQEHVRALRAAAPPEPPVARPTPQVVGSVAAFDAPVRAAVPAAPRVAYVDPRAVMQRTTHIENAPPAQMQPEPSAPVSPQAAYTAELAAADAAARAAGRPRADARTMRDIMVRHFPGVQIPSDFGPNILQG